MLGHAWVAENSACVLRLSTPHELSHHSCIMRLIGFNKCGASKFDPLGRVSWLRLLSWALKLIVLSSREDLDGVQAVRPSHDPFQNLWHNESFEPIQLSQHNPTPKMRFTGSQTVRPMIPRGGLKSQSIQWLLLADFLI